MNHSPDRKTDGLLEQVRALPNRPGVYLFRGKKGETLYVGKAKSLRSRVRSYFGPGSERSVLTRDLARRIRALETFVTASEAEALLLEWNLIRQFRPRYNIQLRDDKSYPYIVVTVREPFPRVFVTRRLQRDGSRYFGPFTDVGAMRRALRMIKRIYTVRSCHYDMPRELPARPCLDYHIGRCKAPCAGYQSEAEYRGMIDEILHVLSGHTSTVRKKLERRMREASESLQFERAAELRDVLRGVGAIERRQTAVDFRGGDYDVVGIADESGRASGVVLGVREGRLVGRELHFLRFVEVEEPGALIAAFVKEVYLHRDVFPREILVGEDFSDRLILAEHLSSRAGATVTIRVPQRGRKRRMVDLAEDNARHELELEGRRSKQADGDEAEGGRPPPGARALHEALGTPAPVRTLACFDISTLGGAESVGAAVWLRDGTPDKTEYRRFRIRHTPRGQVDDYAMMQEIVGRYFHRRVKEDRELPDLVVIDGGMGQLGAARQAMEAAGVSDLPVVALAKREEEVHIPGRSQPLRLSRHDAGLQWLQRVRNEAHRFAVEYHRSLRTERTLRTRLADIPGIGPTRERELLRRFGSLDAIRAASDEQLRAVPGIGPATTARIRNALSRANGAASAE